MQQTDALMLATLVLGWLWQGMRSVKNWPNWLSYGLFGFAGLAVYALTLPEASLPDFHKWDSVRLALFAAAQFILAARGAAASSKDAKIAPQTNSL